MSKFHTEIKDSDGNRFLVPADKREEALAYLEACEGYWDEGDFETDPPAMPDYMKELR